MNLDLAEIILIALIILVLAIIIIRYKLKDYLKSRKQKKRFERGHELEYDAKKFLEKNGYRILHEQFQAIHRFNENGNEKESKLIVDYVVKKNGKQYLVEVKSGKSAISANNKDTRRQLLEYDFAIENDGVFLLDMENKEMKRITFYPKAELRKRDSRIVFLILGIIGILVPFWSVKILIIVVLIVVYRFW